MSRPSPSAAVPPFVALASHPVRWRVLQELAKTDRQVGELTQLLGRPQALVSYHLGRLRTAGLVSSRRSSFDGRAQYYRLHLDRCSASLAATGSALHPGLVAEGRPAFGCPPGSTKRRARVLFLCTGNGSRSQIAEALLRHRSGGAIEVASAGSHPKPIHPNAIAVLAARGIDISEARSKPLSLFTRRRFDFVITLCDRVREVCPEFPGESPAMHWSTEDPSRVPGGVRATLPAFRALAAELATRIEYLLPIVDQSLPQRNVRHDR
jgi:protein-tyrosine-phosphatase